jgi:polyhydroxyalkanoate synthesis regulator phasin
VNLELGIASATKKKVESLMDGLVENGKLVRKEKAKALTEIFQTLQKKDKDFEEKTNAIVSEALSDVQVETQEDIKKLNKDIADLEKILATNSNGNE